MTAQGYFSNWLNYTQEDTASLLAPTEPLPNIEFTVLEDSEINSFYCCPKSYFEINGEQAPQLIEGFLNYDLLETDPKLFKELYIKLLRHTCLTPEKEYPIEAICNVVYCDIGQEKVLDFLDREGLLDLTNDWLDTLYSQGYQFD